MKQFNDLSNRKFSLLIALFVNDKNLPEYKRIWHCKCDCGNECDVCEKVY